MIARCCRNPDVRARKFFALLCLFLCIIFCRWIWGSAPIPLAMPLSFTAGNRIKRNTSVFSSFHELIPSIQLGTVTLAGWRVVSVARQYVRLSTQRMRGASRAINRSAQRGPAVSWAPHVGAHECNRAASVVRLSVCPSVNFALIASSTTEMAGSPSNLHMMVPRRACIQSVLKVKVAVKGHVIRALL